MGRHYPVYIACGRKVFGDCVCVNPMRFAVCIPVGHQPKAAFTRERLRLCTVCVFKKLFRSHAFVSFNVSVQTRPLETLYAGTVSGAVTSAKIRETMQIQAVFSSCKRRLRLLSAHKQLSHGLCFHITLFWCENPPAREKALELHTVSDIILVVWNIWHLLTAECNCICRVILSRH